MKKDQLFNNLLSITIEGYIELFVNSFINITTTDFTNNGDILGVFVAVLCLCLILGFLPMVLIWILVTKKVEDIYKK